VPKNSLVERLETLEMQFKEMQHQNERLKAVIEIQNVMSRYEYFHTADLQEETVALWAKKAPNIWANVPSFGLYKGHEGIRRLYVGAHQSFGEAARVGMMHMHSLTTPVIEVAGDGQTARAVWISPGHETGSPPGGKPQAFWAWLKYGVDFIKEDGRWKFWHLEVFGIFFTPYEKSWVEQSMPDERIVLPDGLKPDKVTRYWTSYTPAAKTQLIPAPPEPYETFDPKMTYYSHVSQKDPALSE
jgi:hypothetical protein